MRKVRIYIALCFAGGAFGALPASALAEWRSTSVNTEGSFLSAALLVNLPMRGVTIECQFDSGKWKIRKATLAQTPVIEGGHFNLTFETATNCKNNGVPFPYNGPSGEFQNKQRGGGLSNIRMLITGGFQFKEATGCTIELPATEANSDLEAGTLKNEGSNQTDELQIKGLTINANSTCEKEGIKGGKEGQMKTVEKAENVEAVGPFGWEAKGEPKVPVKVLKPGEFKYEKGVAFRCASTEMGARGSVQGEGQVKKHEKEGEQVSSKTGPNLNLQIKWGSGCTAEVGATKVAAEIKECELQLSREEKSLTAWGAVATTCLAKLGGICEVLIPAAMEIPDSGLGINVGLTEATLENSGSNQIDKINLKGGGSGQAAGEGVFAESLGGHPLCPLKKSTEEAELTGLEVEAEGVKAF